MEKKFHKDFKLLPETMQSLLHEILKKVNPDKIVLFGSRARGTSRENSDFDIAFLGITNLEAWTKVILEVDESPLTLYKVDLVRFETLTTDYKNAILNEGKLLYG